MDQDTDIRREDKTMRKCWGPWVGGLYVAVEVLENLEKSDPHKTEVQ